MDTERYWQEIRRRVCEKCIDSDGTGTCRVDPATGCALRSYLPLIIAAVNRVSSDRVADYVSDLRGIVCAQCRHQSADARCAVRDGVECALERYFPLVIEAIESVNQTLRAVQTTI